VARSALSPSRLMASGSSPGRATRQYGSGMLLQVQYYKYSRATGVQSDPSPSRLTASGSSLGRATRQYGFGMLLQV
jgi:hypothetical protein